MADSTIAKSYYDQRVGDPASRYISPSDAKSAIDQIYADLNTEIADVAGGNAGHVLFDEGSELTARPGLNFVGSGVTAADDSVNNRTVVTIPGGSGSGGHIVQDEGSILSARTGLNFVGAGVTATDDSVNDRTIVTIPGGAGGIDQATADARYINVTGDAMTGALTVLAPTVAGHPATMGWTQSYTAPVLVLGPTDPIPGGTVAGTVIIRKLS